MLCRTRIYVPIVGGSYIAELNNGKDIARVRFGLVFIATSSIVTTGGSAMLRIPTQQLKSDTTQRAHTGVDFSRLTLESMITSESRAQRMIPFFVYLLLDS
jgi:hypothetical protein